MVWGLLYSNINNRGRMENTEYVESVEEEAVETGEI